MTEYQPHENGHVDTIYKQSEQGEDVLTDPPAGLDGFSETSDT